jgi:hypothetical protein
MTRAEPLGRSPTPVRVLFVWLTHCSHPMQAHRVAAICDIGNYVVCNLVVVLPGRLPLVLAVQPIRPI